MSIAVREREAAWFVYPIGAWGLALLFLFVFDRTGTALALCYPLTVWLGFACIRWGRRTAQRLQQGELTRSEADLGVKWIGQLLATSAAAPAIIFLANNPLEQAAWGLCISIGIVSALAYLGVSMLVRLSNRFAHGLALTLACVALPLNATGALSLGFWLGLFDPLLHTLPGGG